MLKGDTYPDLLFILCRVRWVMEDLVQRLVKAVIISLVNFSPGPAAGCSLKNVINLVILVKGSFDHLRRIRDTLASVASGNGKRIGKELCL